MSKISEMVEWTIGIINSHKYRYSQDWDKRWGHCKTDLAFDCSALMISALQHVGVEVYGASYTGNMKNIGMSADVELFAFTSSYKPQVGDILFWHQSNNVGHTVMYIGNNQIAEAKSTKAGLVISPYYVGKWQYVIRIKEGGVPNTPTVEVKNTVMVEMNVLRKGDKNSQVKTLQILLNAKNNAKLEVDGSFGGNTLNAVKNYQKSKGLEVDGVVGKNSWNSLLH